MEFTRIYLAQNRNTIAMAQLFQALLWTFIAHFNKRGRNFRSRTGRKTEGQEKQFLKKGYTLSFCVAFYFYSCAREKFRMGILFLAHNKKIDCLC